MTSDLNALEAPLLPGAGRASSKRPRSMVSASAVASRLGTPVSALKDADAIIQATDRVGAVVSPVKAARTRYARSTADRELGEIDALLEQVAGGASRGGPFAPMLTLLIGLGLYGGAVTFILSPVLIDADVAAEFGVTPSAIIATEVQGPGPTKPQDPLSLVVPLPDMLLPDNMVGVYEDTYTLTVGSQTT